MNTNSDSKKDKIIGVIGGMGPAATQLFYGMVIDRTDAHCDQDHVDMIILNHASMPDRTRSIVEGNTDELTEKLIADAQMLERNGAEAIVIPCNTSHAFAAEIEDKISIPLINIVKETVASLNQQGVTKAGILATDGTIKTELYQNELKRNGIEAYVPPFDIQKIVMAMIYEGVKNGNGVDRESFDTVERNLRENNCDAAILACTELSVIKALLSLDDFFVDAMMVLAERAIQFTGKVLKK